MSRRALALIAVLAAALAAQEAAPPWLLNAGFEELAPDGTPSGWRGHDYRTGGTAALAEGDAHGGSRCAVLRSATAEQRAAWMQKIAWPAEARGITVGGWYRTRGTDAAAPDRGASLRVLFHRSLEAWDEIGLRQGFFPASATWQAAQVTLRVPRDTRAVVLEAFHWLTPGETHWDDLWVRPATAAELAAASLPPALAVDREPVPGQNKPYTPADGAVATVNPPPFLWLPSGSDATYRLEIGPDETFAGDAVRRHEALPWCCLMLTEALPAGVWYWRYGVDLDGVPTVWSRPRRFTVPPGAAPWAYPGREALQVDPARPRLFVPARRLADLRRRAREGDLKGTADSLVAAVARFAGEEIIPEPAFLPRGGDERTRAYATLIRTTRQPMDRMETAALAYLLSGDAACGDEARRRLLHFVAWDPRGSTGVFHNDEPAMWIMMRGCRAYDWTWDLFTPAERAGIEACMRQRAADFFELLRRKPYENNPYESHAGRILGFLGEAAIAFLPDWPEARTWLDYVTQIYWGVYPAWGGDDGGWNEGPGYWSAYMSFALHAVVALREATGIDLSRRAFFRNTPWYYLYLTPPYSQMAPFGDGSQFAPSRSAELMYWFSTLNQEPRQRWYADSLGRDGGQSILGVVLKDDTLVGRPPLDMPSSRLFEQAGLACLHSAFGQAEDDVAFSLRSAPLGAVSHGHNDHNCFVLEAYGEALAIASGHYNYYGSAHHAQWTRQTKAKCGITVDGGQGQQRGYEARGRITGFIHGEGFDYVAGDASAAYGDLLTRAVRRVVHLRPGLVVMLDDLASATPRRFEYWLHALDEMAVDAAARAVTIRRPKASLRAEFLMPPALAFTQTDQFDTPVAWPPDRTFSNQWHLTAATPEPDTTGVFLTVLTPARAGEDDRRPRAEALESATARGVRLHFPDGSQAEVAFARPGQDGPMSLGSLRCDGTVAAVRRDPAGRPCAWLAVGATHLENGGHALVQADAAMTIAAAITPDGGRVDSAGPGGAVRLWWPRPPQAVRRGADAVDHTAGNDALGLSLRAREDQVVIGAAP